MPIIAKDKEEKKIEKNENTLDFRKNEKIVNISEASFGENKNKESIDAEKYEEGSKQELNACYLDVCAYNNNNVINEEKKEDPVQNIIDENLTYGNSNEIKKNDEKAIMMGDGDFCSNEVKRNIVIKNAGEGKDKIEKMKGGKEEDRQDNLLLDEHQKQKDEKIGK